ncbi:hypothetical protein, partial [Escherichia coli]|uniref:hypothetical protein n=1 Tax=Escherichia coli TaxID=562 RepID=UPI0019D58DE0
SARSRKRGRKRWLRDATTAAGRLPLAESVWFGTHHPEQKTGPDTACVCHGRNGAQPAAAQQSGI